MDNFGMQPPNPVKNTFGPPAQLYLPPKDNKKKTGIIVLCICGAVLLMILGGWYHHVHSPAYKVQKGLLNLVREIDGRKNPLVEKAGLGKVRQMMAQKGYAADTRLNFTFDTGIDYLGELTFGVDTAYEKDVEGREMSASTDLSLMNYEFGHVELYGDRDKFYFSIPELKLEDMYIENENVLAQYNRSVWPDLFGEAYGDDFNIELFGDKWLFADEEGIVSAFRREYEWQLAECGRHMDIERAGQDLYRVSFESLYFNELVRQVLYDYVDFMPFGREEAMGALSYFDVVSNAEEVSFLLEIDSANRIRNIRIEEPLSLYKGDMKISGDVYFLGGDYSIDKMQGKIEIKRDREEQTAAYDLTWQLVQSLEAENYRAESNVRYSVTENGEKSNYALDCDLECDARRDSFAVDMTWKSQVGTVGMTAEGGLSHIKQGESFDLELDELVLTLDDEELLLVRGEASVEPLARRVKQNVKPQTAFFELTYAEWERRLDDLIDEWSYMLDGLFW